jgi:hypothetical protein
VVGAVYKKVECSYLLGGWAGSLVRGGTWWPYLDQATHSGSIIASIMHYMHAKR